MWVTLRASRSKAKAWHMIFSGIISQNKAIKLIIKLAVDLITKDFVENLLSRKARQYFYILKLN